MLCRCRCLFDSHPCSFVTSDTPLRNGNPDQRRFDIEVLQPAYADTQVAVDHIPSADLRTGARKKERSMSGYQCRTLQTLGWVSMQLLKQNVESKKPGAIFVAEVMLKLVGGLKNEV